VATVGRLRSVFRALPCEDPLQTHETGNAVAPAGAAQRVCQPRAAVGLAAADKFVPMRARKRVFSISRGPGWRRRSTQS
jgi:hypothetical protein